ncbi:MAG: hypothetical protein R3B93_19040 [Bacteroidia bacterium]
MNSNDKPLFKIRKDPKKNKTEVLNDCYDLFHDHIPYIISEENSFYNIGLKWPDFLEWFVDPNTFTVAKDLYSLAPSQIASFQKIYSIKGVEIVLSMFHSRAILTPALVWQKQGIKIDQVVHVDDHSDLMSMALYFSNKDNCYRTSLYKDKITIDNIASLYSAIEQGIINKGNFLSTYSILEPENDIIYVNEKLAEQEYALIPQKGEIKLGSSVIEIFSLLYEKNQKDSSTKIQIRPKIPVDLEGNNIWLDIDFDAFCNRYNGDSDKSEIVITNAEIERTNERINDFLNQFERIKWLSKIKAISLAVSPGFFPSDYWGNVVPKLFNFIVDKINSTK